MYWNSNFPVKVSYSLLKVDCNLFETDARKAGLGRGRSVSPSWHQRRSSVPLLAWGEPGRWECSAMRPRRRWVWGGSITGANCTDQRPKEGTNRGFCKWDRIQGLMGKKPTAGRASRIKTGWEKLKKNWVWCSDHQPPLCFFRQPSTLWVDLGSSQGCLLPGTS